MDSRFATWPKSDQRPQGGYPLSALFLLLGLAGVLLALVSSIPELMRRNEVDGDSVVLACMGGAGPMWLVGCIVGLYQHHRVRGIVLGGCVGLVLGAMMGPLLLVPEIDFPRVLLVAIVGSIALVTVSAIARVRSAGNDVENNRSRPTDPLGPSQSPGQVGKTPPNPWDSAQARNDESASKSE